MLSRILLSDTRLTITDGVLAAGKAFFASYNCEDNQYVASGSDAGVRPPVLVLQEEEHSHQWCLLTEYGNYGRT